MNEANGSSQASASSVGIKVSNCIMRDLNQILGFECFILTRSASEGSATFPLGRPSLALRVSIVTDFMFWFISKYPCAIHSHLRTMFIVYPLSSLPLSTSTLMWLL